MSRRFGSSPGPFGFSIFFAQCFSLGKNFARKKRNKNHLCDYYIMILIYSASVIRDTRIHSGFLLLRNKNKLAQRQHFPPSFTASKKKLGREKKKIAFWVGRHRKAFLCVRQNVTISPKIVPHSWEKERVSRCPCTVDAPK